MNNLLCNLISRHGRIIVHLQALPAVSLDLFILTFIATLAAAAAVCAAEAEQRGDNRVPGLQGAQRPRQKVPVAQGGGQAARAAALHHIDNDHEDDQHDDRHTNTGQNLPASQRQAEYSER